MPITTIRGLNKTQLRNELTRIRNETRLYSFLPVDDFNFVIEALEHFNFSYKKDGLKGIKTVKSDKKWKNTAGSKSLALVYEDDLKVRVGIKSLLDGKDDLWNGFRNAVHDQVFDFKVKQNTTGRKYQAHHVKSFKTLVEDFLALHNIAFSDLCMYGEYIGFIDDERNYEFEIHEEWQLYHEKHAELKLVTKKQHIKEHRDE